MSSFTTTSKTNVRPIFRHQQMKKQKRRTFGQKGFKQRLLVITKTCMNYNQENC